MKKITFIVPCYNVERYVEDCLDSIYSQSMSDNDFEIICINDCSTDNTGSILDDYSKRKTNIRVINHSTNKTIGGARNSGIDIAEGEYIWFVDPDDRVFRNCASVLYETASREDADILFFNFEKTDELLNHIETHSVFHDVAALPGQQFICRYFNGRLREFCIAWQSLFKTEFLHKHNIRHPEMRKSADVTFVWECVCSAGKVASSKLIGYSYRTNPYSVSNFRKKAEVLFSEKILFAKQIVILLDKGIVTEESIRDDMRRTLSWCATSSLSSIKGLSDSELCAYYDLILNHRDVVKEIKPYMNRKDRILYSFLLGKTAWKWFLRRI